METTSFFLGMEKPHRFSKPMRFSFGEKRYSGQREIAPEKTKLSKKESFDWFY
jgi:hypothetical protein